jgi:hypothetical protein
MLVDPQRILFIGMPAHALPARPYNFFDTFNVNEFLLVAWNAETFVADTQEKTGQSFESYHHPFVYRRFKELYEEKLSQILNWTRAGHVLVIFPFSFNSGFKTDGTSGVVNIDLNHFPPFNLISLAPASSGSLNVVDNFSDQFSEFVDILRHDLVFLGEDIIPLFRTGGVQQERSEIAGAAFRVGKGAIVFSPPPKAWSDPKMLEYFNALAKLPQLLSRPLDPLPDRTGAFQRTALWLAALAAMITAMVAFSPFWATQVAQLLPWGEKPSAAGRDYAALAARLTEIEKRPVSPSFDLEAIKSAENALARRVDKLEVAVSHLQEQSVTQQPKALAAPAPPAARPRLSAEEIAEILARGDALLRTGDVASARLFYERAARGGDGQSALRLGATFDPAFLNRDVLRGVRGDLAEARIWYRHARDLGEAEAERRLKSLEPVEHEQRALDTSDFTQRQR